jgi:hypothetical protein
MCYFFNSARPSLTVNQNNILYNKNKTDKDNMHIRWQRKAGASPRPTGMRWAIRWIAPALRKGIDARGQL